MNAVLLDNMENFSNRVNEVIHYKTLRYINDTHNDN